MKSSREQFEDWFNEIMKPAMEKIDIDWPERQLVNDVSWGAWKASRAAIEITLPDCDYYQTTWQYQDAAEIKIKELGLTVK